MAGFGRNDSLSGIEQEFVLIRFVCQQTKTSPDMIFAKNCTFEFFDTFSPKRCKLNMRGFADKRLRVLVKVFEGGKRYTSLQ